MLENLSYRLDYPAGQSDWFHSRNQRPKIHGPTRPNSIPGLRPRQGRRALDRAQFVSADQAGTGTRSYLFRYGRDGENQWLGLGSVADKPLSEARDEATELRALVRRGGDPLADREHKASPKKAKAPTFAECAERYIEAHSPGWKNDKHIAQWESTIRMYVNPVIGKLPVDKVGVDHVMKVLAPIWTSKPETASRLRGRIEKVLGWATAMKHRTGDNPAAWDGALSHLLPPLSKVRRIEHHKAMDYREVPKLMAELNGSESARALAFTILTASRTGETIGAVPAEIDVKGKLWVLPAERMKAGREHRVPLSHSAMALLPQKLEGRTYLFEGIKPGRPLSNMAMLMLLRDLRGDGFTVHGFRSAFSTAWEPWRRTGHGPFQSVTNSWC